MPPAPSPKKNPSFPMCYTAFNQKIKSISPFPPAGPIDSFDQTNAVVEWYSWTFKFSLKTGGFCFSLGAYCQWSHTQWREARQGPGHPGSSPREAPSCLQWWEGLQTTCHCCLITKSCPFLWEPLDCCLPASSVVGFSRQEYWSG